MDAGNQDCRYKNGISGLDPKIFGHTAPPVRNTKHLIFFRMDTGFACGAHRRGTARKAINQRHMVVGRGGYGVTPGTPCSAGRVRNLLIYQEKRQGATLSDECDPRWRLVDHQAVELPSTTFCRFARAREILDENYSHLNPQVMG